MSQSQTLFAAALIAGYAVMIVVLIRRRRALRDTDIRWLVAALVIALLGTALGMLPADAHTDPHRAPYMLDTLTRPALEVIAANLMLVMATYHLLRYLQIRSARMFTLLALIWWAAHAALSITADELTIGTRGWYRFVYDPIAWPNAVAFAGWLVLGVALMLTALYAFYRAHLPENANRALFGELLILPMVVGVALAASDEAFLTEAGQLILFAGLAGAVYSVTVFRVLDIRRTFRQATATGILTAITALVIYVALVLAQQLAVDPDRIYAILALLALGVAVVYIPFRSILQAMTDRATGLAPLHVAPKLQRFSAEISGAVELDQVVEITLRALSEALRVRRGGLILASENGGEGVLLLEPFKRGPGELPDVHGYLHGDSPVLAHFLDQRAPLLQYDLDYAPGYAATPAQEREFFEALHMSAYAPVIVQDQMIGILCSGPKISDDPFMQGDLEVLSTIANQAGVALRNARLVADLRRREAEQADLNATLSATKEQLERLDSVKTDFITIASHELRTPLAQIRGYTDIIEVLNADGMLDPDQIAGMTANMSKAADRLEELIGAMLDVSQLDGDAMDLHFTTVSIEACARQAIEPLTDSIKNRRLMLAARGLRDLPPIQGDMQRLVQAFRNVVLNAIKYTPDGGRIEIAGRLQDEDIVITIQDSGIGIAPENHELIFEKFFRAHDPSLHSTGTTKFMGAGPGLGLTIARGVIMAHGGRIWVESDTYDPERLPGSTFIIALPLRAPQTAARISPFDTTISLSATALHQAVAARSGAAPAASTSPTVPRPPRGLRERAASAARPTKKQDPAP